MYRVLKTCMAILLCLINYFKEKELKKKGTLCVNIVSCRITKTNTFPVSVGK